MKPFRVAVLLSLALFVGVTVCAQTKKYAVKSGIITFDQTSVVSSIELLARVVVTFDDYGMKECKETFKDSKLVEVFFSDGKFLYSLKPEKYLAFKRGEAYRGTEPKSDWTELSLKDKQGGKAKMLPARTIAGKNCEAFQHIQGSTTVVYAGWSGIMLLMDVRNDMVKVTTTATKLEENVEVPSTKFQIPAGHTVQ